VPSRTRERASADELMAFLRERLSAYKVPARIVMMDALPRNAMMKLDRKALLQQLAAHQASR